MSDPERYSSPASGSDELERELLGSLRDVSPRGDEKARVWQGIATRLAAVSVVGASAATAGSAAAASSSAGSAGSSLAGASWITKLALATAVTTGVVGGGYFAARSFAPRASTPAPVVARPSGGHAPPRAQRTELSVETPVPTANPPPQSERPASKRRAGTASEMLAAESGLLAEARAKLRSGDASSAAAALERLRSEFPAGVLSQEREVLSIEVLAAQGDAAGARRRAERFIQAHPRSPHSETLRRFVETP